jgi:hypothetical protein
LASGTSDRLFFASRARAAVGAGRLLASVPGRGAEGGIFTRYFKVFRADVCP